MIRLCILATFALSLSAADPLARALAQMDKAAPQFKCMTADIQETVYTQVVDEKTVTGGTIRLRRVKAGDVRFLVEFTHPEKEAKSVAFAGNEIRTYKPRENLEQIYDVTTHKAALEQALLLGFGATRGEIEANYEVSYVGAESVNGQSAAEIKLVPKAKELQSQVQEADLWISDSLGVPVQQKFIYAHAGGNYSLFTYSNLRLVASLPDKDLQIKLPKGVQVTRVGK
jgi:outer membrane lipoprotein-sorting protein